MDGAGTISGRWALAAGRAAVKGCSICHGPTLPGTRLCTQCKAALKRARQETVSELVTVPARETARTSTRSRAALPAIALRAPGTSLAFRASALVLLAIAAAAVAYGALRFVRPAEPLPPVHAEPAGAALPAVADAPSAPPSAPAVLREAAAPTVPSPPVKPAAARPPERPAAKRVVEAPPPPTALAVTQFASAPEPPAPTVAAEPIPAPPPAPPVDRWKQMAESIAQTCGREGFFAGVVCSERIRIQYCEGYWGRVPQCPSGVSNDHGK